jgi:hypothetical protein
MKRLKLLGEVLSKAQQKQIYGGYGEKHTIFCKKADTSVPACEITVDSCPPWNEWQAKCENDQTCYDYLNSFGCV